MNARERFLAVMDFQPVRSLKWEFGYWVAAVWRWYEEGLPKTYPPPEGMGEGEEWRGSAVGWRDEVDRDYDIQEYTHLDDGLRRIKLNNYLYPPFEVEVLEDHGDWVLERNEQGIIQKRTKDISSLPSWVCGPVETRDDWERLKAERLQPTLEGRLPEGWPQMVEEYNRRSYPLSIMGVQGFYGTPRYLFGQEQLLYAYYDDPELLDDINAYLCDFWMAICEPILKQVQPDVVQMWEDMSYRGGSLISPEHFRRFMLPHYKRLTSFFRDYGVENVLVDTDGDCWKLIPLFIEGGVTGMYPMEVQSGMDVVEVRRAFPRLQILGGIDKRVLAWGKEAIHGELEAKVPWMLTRGGYVPYVDHFVTPEASLDNFSYYRQRLNEMIDASGEAG